MCTKKMQGIIENLLEREIQVQAQLAMETNESLDEV